MCLLNAVLTIAGDFEPREARALAMKYFSHLPAGQRAKRPQPPVLEPHERKVITYVGPCEAPSCLFSMEYSRSL